MSVKKEQRRQNKATGDLREEVEMLDVKLSSLVNVLEERRIAGHDEWRKEEKKG